jgi:hypothetical protein
MFYGQRQHFSLTPIQARIGQSADCLSAWVANPR